MQPQSGLAVRGRFLGRAFRLFRRLGSRFGLLLATAGARIIGSTALIGGGRLCLGRCRLHLGGAAGQGIRLRGRLGLLRLLARGMLLRLVVR